MNGCTRGPSADRRRYLHGVLLLSIYALLLLALLYAVVCFVYWLVQERFIFVRFRVARD